MTATRCIGFNQSDVERQTGLTREVLRKWELRYGFPLPQRGARGQRLYSGDTVDKLVLLARLSRLGQRVSALIGLDVATLQALLHRHLLQVEVPTGTDVAARAAAQSDLLQSLLPGAPAHALAQCLQRYLDMVGLELFVSDLLPAFNLAVGQAWFEHRLSVAAEHRYSAQVRQVVLRALPLQGWHAAQPRVLLTTPPGELHALGLLGLHALLCLRGADCVDLGTETPLQDLAQAAGELQAGVVAVSISRSLESAHAQAYVHTLLQLLPPTCELWVGGAGSVRLHPGKSPRCRSFDLARQAVQRWQQLASVQQVQLT